MKKAVIIGAGQNGRGLIAPILQNNGYHITFLDKDPTLIAQLQAEREYKIHYFGKVKEQRIYDFSAYSTDSVEGLTDLSNADVIFTSVFADNIPSLIPLLKKSEKNSRCIICCENGVNVKQPLVDAKIKGTISEGAIFCTTLRLDTKKLDIWSEDFVELPIAKVNGIVRLQGMPLEEDFSSLIQRKIYTYNFISGIVAYLGSYLSYESYGEASNDETIAKVIQYNVPIISKVVANEFQISYEEQLAFTSRAVMKFSNREIIDSIYRNARQAKRKLGMKERLFVPLALALKYGECTKSIETIIAAALYYGYSKENLAVGEILKEADQTLHHKAVMERILHKFDGFVAGVDLKQIIASDENCEERKTTG